MKAFILPIIILLFASCEDKDTYCFTCATSQAGQTEEFTRCNITKEEASDIERAGTEIDAEGLKHPFVVEMKKHTVCRRAE